MGGESWTSGTQETITWSSGGFAGNVVIELSSDGGATFPTEIATVANSGSYQWTIPTENLTTMRVRVKSTDTPTISDVSNANFTIVNGATYVIRGSSSASTIDGVAQTFCGGDGMCPSSGDAYTVPNGVTIAALNLRNGAYVIISAGNTATIRNVSIDNTSTLVINKSVSFDSLTVTSGTVTSTAYNGTWNGSVWSSAPAAGNGRIDITVTGAVAIAAAGTITADAFGYPSMQGNHGQAHDGRPGTGGGRKVNYDAPGGGAYGSVGSGGSAGAAAFGGTDFFNSDKLYLGPSGAGGQVYQSDGPDDYYWGGRGGGTIRINAGSFSNAGIITANGQNAPAGKGGGGAGGSVVITATGAVSNTGTIRANGGTGSGGGGSGGAGRIYLTGGEVGTIGGTISPFPHAAILDLIGTTNVSSITLTASTTTITINGTTYSFGVSPADVLNTYSLVGTVTINGGTFAVGSTVTFDSLNLSSGTLSFNSASSIGDINMSGGELNINTAFTNTPNFVQSGGTTYLRSIPTFNDFDLGSGGSTATITGIAYGGTFNGTVWSQTPGAGNGHVRFNVNGSAVIGSNGRILADSFGYPSMQGNHGQAHDGRPGTGGGRLINYENPGGGAYGSVGAGGSEGAATFGLSDFFNADKLYLGPSGAGGVVYQSDGPDDTYWGGKGGGAIRITANNFSNAGIISANGQAAPAGKGGGGAGGTVVIDASGFIANTGTIRSQGGAGSNGGNGGAGRIYLNGASLGTFTGTVDPAPHSVFYPLIGVANVNNITLSSSSLALGTTNGTYNFGTAPNDVLATYSGRSLDAVTIQSGSFTIANNMTIGTLTFQSGTLSISSNIAVDTLTMQSGTLTISGSTTVGAFSMAGGTFNLNTAFANTPSFTQTGGTTTLRVTPTFTDFVLGTGAQTATVTSVPFTGTYTSSWSTTPGIGNGHVRINATGDMTIGANGRILADEFGYPSSSGNHGYDSNGRPGTGGGRKINYDAPGGGSYGTVGVGGSAGAAAFGYADFMSDSKLYLGTGGGGGQVFQSDGPDDYYWGGRGGGAIKLTAVNFSNEGIISANGQNAPAGKGGGGSGGTVVVQASGTFSSTGTIRAIGGTGTGGGGTGGFGRIYLSGTVGNLSGTVNPAPHHDLLNGIDLTNIVSLTATSSSLQIATSGPTFNFGTVQSEASDNSKHILSRFGSNLIPTINMSSGTFVLNQAIHAGTFNMSGGTLTVSTNFGTPPDFAQTGGTTYLNTSTTFNSFSLGTGASASVLTTGSYTGTWSASSWSSAPAAGNGQIRITVQGHTEIGANGSLVVDGLGYPVSTPGGNGYSFDGFPGTAGGRNGYSNVGGGSYGTLGGGNSGSTFGAADFFTAYYLGSSGGGGSVSNSDGSDDHYYGGRGGGAIVMTTDTLNNAGVISANGQNAPVGRGGGGSGGTIVIDATGELSNTGTIRAVGGSGVGGGGTGGSGRIRVTSGTNGTMTGTINPASS